MQSYKVGDQVLFGRSSGEQTLGTVMKVNQKTPKVRQDESRGTMKAHRVGTIWTVPPSLCSPANGAVAKPTQATLPMALPVAKTASNDAIAKSIGLPRDMVGEQITVNGTTYTVMGYNPNRPKYPLTVKGPQGGMYRMDVPSVLKAVGVTAAPKTKRPDAKIMQDILNVYSSLSPENISWDGERSRSEVAKASARLNRELRELEAELGRKVTESQAYDWYSAQRLPAEGGARWA